MEHEKSIDANLESKIKNMLLRGQRVEAITFVLNTLKIGLKNSKDLVDKIDESQKK
jgi:ribosomal protein L7/L12